VEVVKSFATTLEFIEIDESLIFRFAQTFYQTIRIGWIDCYGLDVCKLPTKLGVGGLHSAQYGNT
jgi:hypothetical protein